MTSADPIAVLKVDERNELESLLMEFDQAWVSTSLQEFGKRVSVNPNRRFRDLAIRELVKVDLQRSWSSNAGRMLGEYLAQFPELGDPQSIDVDLIVAEYEARRTVEANLEFSSYQSRFPRQFDQAKKLLDQIVDSHVVTPSKTTQERSQASVDTSRIDAVRDTKAGEKRKTVVDLPSQFGRYRIVKELGSGAMGKVYLAHDEQLDRQVALKTPTFTGGKDDEMVTRFYREARSAAKIQHRNICPVYDVGEIDGRHFISMAFVKGRCMSEFIKPDKLPPQRTSAILVQRLAAALAEAHDHNVIHRDLKPANIMIDLKKEPIVMDFGLARQMDVESRVTQSGMAVGTPAYMSPEQIRGELDKVGTTADIYALGVILYELLSGQIPFRGPIAKVVYSIVHEQPVPPSQIREGIDPTLEAICDKMMAKNQGERFQSMRDVAAALKKYLKGETRAKQLAIDKAKASDEKEPGSGSTKLNETGALNAFFAAQGTQDPLQTAIEPSKSVEPTPVVQPKPSSSSKRGGGRAKLIALCLGGAALLASVIIYLADGTRIEIEDGTQAKVETNPDGTLKSITTGTQSTEQVGEANARSAVPVAQSGTITIANQVGSSSLAASPDGRSFASAEAGNPARITVWNSRTGESISKFVIQGAEGATPRDLSYSHDGASLGYSIGDSFLTMDASSGKRQSRMDFSAAPAVVMFPKRSLALALFHEQNVHRLQRSDVPQRVRIWNWKTNKVLHDDVLPIQQGIALSFPSISPDERFVTFGWGHHHVRYDLSIGGEKASLGKRTTTEKLIRVRGPLVHSPDSKFAVASVKSSDFMGVFLDTESGKVLHRFDPRTAQTSNRGHEFGCNVAFTSDGKKFVSADHNGRVALWTFPDGKLTRELGQFRADANHNPPQVAVTIDDRAIVAGDNSDSRIVIHDLGIATERTSALAARPNISSPKVDQSSLGSMTPKEVLTSDEWEWSDPVFLGSFFGDSRNLDSELRSEFTTWYAPLTGNDIQLYPGIDQGSGKTDIWQFSREPNDAQWTEAVNLGSVVNSAENDGGPSLSADGLKMVFSSDRPEGEPWKSDLWITSRKSIGADWSQPMNLGQWANSSGKWDGHPCFAENGQAIYFSSGRNTGHGGSDLYVTRLHKERRWSNAENLGRTVNSSAGEMGPTVSSDGLVLVFFSPDRPGGHGHHDLWMTHRDSMTDPWSSPVNLGRRVNTANPEIPRAISSDGRLLLFDRIPLTGKGTEGHGIWGTRRVPKQDTPTAVRTPTQTPTAGSYANEDWVDLFNGNDLAGWKQVHRKNVWQVRDGFIESRARKGGEKVGGWLETEETFMNFELALEYYMPTNGNSGIFLRTKSGGSVIGSDQLEIQLLDDSGSKHKTAKQEHVTGAVYGVIAPKQKAPAWANAWNKMNIRAVGSQITVVVNGVTIVNTDLNLHRAKIDGRFQYSSLGPVGLQWHGDNVRFRQIRIRPIESAGN